MEGRDTDNKAPFNDLSFSVVGDDNAPQYFEINKAGEVNVRTSLRSAPGDETQYKLRIQVGQRGSFVN